MREIKFRGLDPISNEWVYGDLIHGVGSKSDKVYILPDRINLANVKNCDPIDGVCVEPKSVGQFTGLKDKNGKEIYEGDILSEKWLVEVYKNEEGTYMVRFHLNHFANRPRSLNKYLLERDVAGTSDIDNFIIGNIYEHPELLNN